MIENLDSKAMAAVSGGIIGGCVCIDDSTVGNWVKTVTENAHDYLNGGHCTPGR